VVAQVARRQSAGAGDGDGQEESRRAVSSHGVHGKLLVLASIHWISF
jgi:hypothetical protein